MSSSQKSSDCRSSDKAPARSNFAQTFNRLSQYIKEKGSLKDIGFEIARKLEPKGRSETTRDLFLVDKEKTGETWAHHGLMDPFPRHAGIGCPSASIIDLDSTESDNSSQPETMEIEPKTGQMTIFYGGKILVFDNVPANKAGEVILLAGNESSHNSNAFVSAAQAEMVKISDSPASCSRTDLTNTPQEHRQPQPQATGSDIPIARRSSLHRFFDKRKDRVTARAPYQVNGNPSSSSRKNGEQIDLNPYKVNGAPSTSSPKNDEQIDLNQYKVNIGPSTSSPKNDEQIDLNRNQVNACGLSTSSPKNDELIDLNR